MTFLIKPIAGNTIKKMLARQAPQIGETFSKGLLKAKPILKEGTAVGKELAETVTNQLVKQAKQSDIGQTIDNRSSELSSVTQKYFGVKPNSTAAQAIDVTAKGLISGMMLGSTILCATYATQDTGNKQNFSEQWDKFRKGMPQAVSLTNTVADAMISKLEKS